MTENRILIVDDEKLISWSLAAMLRKGGYQVDTASSGSEALGKFHELEPHLVMLDICLPDIDGPHLLKTFKAANAEVSVVMMTAFASADCAVQTLQDGAEDFFGKPFDMEDIKGVVDRIFEKKLLTKEAAGVGAGVRSESQQEKLIGNSQKMIEIFKMIKICADADAKTVLITGESGTGKELVAQAIHCHSARSGAPFIEVNCASIPENLLENELFGHERGAYTDASQKQKGVFEMAQGGTLFLDEIGDMPFAMQAKILKVIETKRFRRLGGHDEVEVDVRIVTATHQSLSKMVQDGRFRSDLFYRLNVMTLALPPLRERGEDIEALVQYFIESFNKEYGKNVRCACAETLAYLTRYDWPGNVRELRHCVDRLMLLAKGPVLSPEYLGAEIKEYRAAVPQTGDGHLLHDFSGEHIVLPASGISLEELEKLLIELALKRSGGNQRKAARFLKTSRDTLRYRMKKFGLGEAPGKGEGGAGPRVAGEAGPL